MYRSSNLIESRKYFLEHFRNCYLTNALYDAVIDADLSTIKYLLEDKNVNPNLLIPEYDAAPLHAAPGIGTEDFSLISIHTLLSHGADPNIATSDGTTPLMISCLWGRENVVKLLLENSANPLLEDVEGKNSFDYALESDNKSVCKIMKELQININSNVIQDTITYSVPVETADFNLLKSNSYQNTESVDFTDIDSDANVIEFYLLNTGFRAINAAFDNKNNENNNVPQGIELTKLSNVSNIVSNPSNKLHEIVKNDQEKSEENSFVSAKSSSTQFSIVSYATDHLKQELKRNKIMYGPVTDTTKKVYQKLLTRIVKGKKSFTFGDELIHYHEILKNTFKENFIEIVSKWYYLEKLLSNNFTDVKKTWRGGKEKQFFTYLLLDPFITNNIPQRKSEMKEVDVWKTFILSIFYVGKGKNSRPFSHLYEALKTMKKKTLSAKVKRIQTIWDKSSGVICLHIFHNIVSAEAHTREAAMIDAIGSRNLTNIQSGEYYGVVKNWSIKQKMQLGIVLLFKALQIYLAEGERQIFASDLT